MVLTKKFGRNFNLPNCDRSDTRHLTDWIEIMPTHIFAHLQLILVLKIQKYALRYIIAMTKKFRFQETFINIMQRYIL